MIKHIYSDDSEVLLHATIRVDYLLQNDRAAYLTTFLYFSHAQNKSPAKILKEKVPKEELRVD